MTHSDAGVGGPEETTTIGTSATEAGGGRFGGGDGGADGPEETVIIVPAGDGIAMPMDGPPAQKGKRPGGNKRSRGFGRGRGPSCAVFVLDSRRH